MKKILVLVLAVVLFICSCICIVYVPDVLKQNAVEKALYNTEWKYWEDYSDYDDEKFKIIHFHSNDCLHKYSVERDYNYDYSYEYDFDSVEGSYWINMEDNTIECSFFGDTIMNKTFAFFFDGGILKLCEINEYNSTTYLEQGEWLSYIVAKNRGQIFNNR